MIFQFKTACAAALSMFVLQTMPAHAALLPAGTYSLSLPDCLGSGTACAGEISTYDVQFPDANILTVDGISGFKMNYPSGQVMEAIGPEGSALSTSGAGFGIIPVSGSGQTAYRFAYPLFPIVVDTSDFTVRELILKTQEIGGDTFLRYSLKATRFLGGQQALSIFAGYAYYEKGGQSTSQVLPTFFAATLIAEDIIEYLEDPTPLSEYDWLGLVGREKLSEAVRLIIAAGTPNNAPSVDFELDGRYGVPEPASILLLSLGLGGMAFARRRRAG